MNMLFSIGVVMAPLLITALALWFAVKRKNKKASFILVIFALVGFSAIQTYAPRNTLHTNHAVIPNAVQSGGKIIRSELIEKTDKMKDFNSVIDRHEKRQSDD